MRLRLIVVGRDRNDPIVAAADGYMERIAHYHSIAVSEVKEEPATSSIPVERIRAAEADRIRKLLCPAEHAVALDERGALLTSRDVAERLVEWARTARGPVSFLIGSAVGLDPGLVSMASERWALSRMTLPHRLARLILCEQLYRACTINRGEPYHK